MTGEILAAIATFCIMAFIWVCFWFVSSPKHWEKELSTFRDLPGDSHD
jgi:hypothetical protein